MPRLTTRRRKTFKWTPERRKAANLIASGKNQSEAAREVGVTPMAVSHWMKSPTFVDYVDRRSMEIGMARRSGRVQGYNKVIEEGIKTILKKLENPNEWYGKNLGDLLKEIREYMKLMAQETGALSGDGNTFNVGVGVGVSQNVGFGLDELQKRFQNRFRVVESVSPKDFKPTMKDMEDFMVEERFQEEARKGEDE